MEFTSSTHTLSLFQQNIITKRKWKRKWREDPICCSSSSSASPITSRRKPTFFIPPRENPLTTEPSAAHHPTNHHPKPPLKRFAALALSDFDFDVVNISNLKLHETKEAEVIFVRNRSGESQLGRNHRRVYYEHTLITPSVELQNITSKITRPQQHASKLAQFHNNPFAFFIPDLLHHHREPSLSSVSVYQFLLITTKKYMGNTVMGQR